MNSSVITLSEFLNLDSSKQKDKIMHCCACQQWAEEVVTSLSFVNSLSELKKLMIKYWSRIDESGYLEAFSAHPKIGDIKVLADKFAIQAHAEQGQVSQASQATLESLMTCNDQYLDKFGFIFIICATGKSADEMLASLQQRLKNQRDEELQTAADEQQKIMLLRLSQIISET